MRLITSALKLLILCVNNQIQKEKLIYTVFPKFTETTAYSNSYLACDNARSLDGLALVAPLPPSAFLPLPKQKQSNYGHPWH